MKTPPLRIGIDVGGTNTDAVIMLGREVRAAFKSPTTQDVGSGIANALTEVLRLARSAGRGHRRRHDRNDALHQRIRAGPIACQGRRHSPGRAGNHELAALRGLAGPVERRRCRTGAHRARRLQLRWQRDCCACPRRARRGCRRRFAMQVCELSRFPPCSHRSTTKQEQLRRATSLLQIIPDAAITLSQ